MAQKNNRKNVVIEFLLHLHPISVKKDSLKFSRTFGLGGINILLFLILVSTGTLLRFSYIPTQQNAYDSIVNLQKLTYFGTLLHATHHWSAMIFLVTSFLHFVRVIYSNSIYYERSKNFYYGLVLFALVLSSNFTGYALPWDQLSYWAITILTNTIKMLPLIGAPIAKFIAGGSKVGANTLFFFYNLHTAVLPLTIFIFIVIHIWLVRANSGVTLPAKESTEKVKTSPELTSRELLAALSVLAFVLLLAFFFPPHLLGKASPAITPADIKAPWYFSGVQEMLLNVHPIFTIFLTPITILLYLIYVSRTKIEQEKIGVWFYSDKGKQAIVYSAAFAALLSFTLILIFEYLFNADNTSLPVLLVNGIIPLLAYLLPAGGFVFYLLRFKKTNKTETALAIITMILTSYITMGFTTTFLRANGMRLIF